MKKLKKFIEIFGWYGTMVILAAYFLVSYLIIQPDGLLFQFLNLSGALGLGSISLLKKAYSVVALNAAWFAIALIAIIKAIL